MARKTATAASEAPVATGTGEADELLTSAFVRGTLKVAPQTLSYWRSTNQGPPSIKIGGSVRYPAREFWAWLARQQAETLRGDTAPAGAHS